MSKIFLSLIVGKKEVHVLCNELRTIHLKIDWDIRKERDY